MSSVVTQSDRFIDQDDAATEFAFSENALRVLEARYLKKDESGACTEDTQRGSLQAERSRYQ